ncbi:hypothetical protein [Lignipirellula cremea]|uniref:hypothetical protein n=1 Tax=Lignipirellula cremea TaxID=2528010 RepID=UPI0011A3840B|nr:hypothetical protein [Lignipirellula cremea]
MNQKNRKIRAAAALSLNGAAEPVSLRVAFLCCRFLPATTQPVRQDPLDARFLGGSRHGDRLHGMPCRPALAKAAQAPYYGGANLT